jgi:uncharacterized coiled-coil DUF342 family protein
MKNEPLINLHPKTDFEKLLFANSYIKELKKENSDLKFEIGVLNSELDELHHELNKPIEKNDYRSMYRQLCKVLVDRNIKIKKLEQTLNNILTKK